MELNTETIVSITREQRELLLCQKSIVIWFTGLSGSGKSTLSGVLEDSLYKQGIKTYLLDGDQVRRGLNKDLSFSVEDRKENIRRIAEVCKFFVDAGLVVVASFISPFSQEREFVRNIIGEDSFFEVYVNCPIDICELRDVKGLYKMARSGLIKDFTGVNSPYEEPLSPDLVVRTDQLSIANSVQYLYNQVIPKILKSNAK